MVDIKPHPKYGFLIASDGRVFIPATKFSKEHWTKGTKTGNGYMNVRLSTKDGRKNIHVHRLVAETFIENPDNKPCIDHINRNKVDNSVENLRWVTLSENQRNTKSVDRVTEEFGVHSYEDPVEYNKKNCRRWYYANREKFNAKRRANRKTEV